MKKEKLTQEMLFFYKLYTSYKENSERWVAAWEFVGEIYVKELNEWHLMSYKVPANGANVFFRNPLLVERQRVQGKSGAKYYAYRIRKNPSPNRIVDPALFDFYKRLQPKKVAEITN